MGSEVDIARFASIKPHSYKHTYVRSPQYRSQAPSPSMKAAARTDDPHCVRVQTPYVATEDYRHQSYVHSRQEYDEVSYSPRNIE